MDWAAALIFGAGIAGWATAAVIALILGGARKEAAELRGTIALRERALVASEEALADVVGAAEDERWRREAVISELQEDIEALRQRALECASDDQIRDGLAALSRRANEV